MLKSVRNIYRNLDAHHELDDNKIELPKIDRIKIIKDETEEEFEGELYLKGLNLEKASLSGEIGEYFSDLSKYIVCPTISI